MTTMPWVKMTVGEYNDSMQQGTSKVIIHARVVPARGRRSDDAADRNVRKATICG